MVSSSSLISVPASSKKPTAATVPRCDSSSGVTRVTPYSTPKVTSSEAA